MERIVVPLDIQRTVRVSATANCRFQTAARIIKLPEAPLTLKTQAAFAVGNALEPVIVKALQSEGFKINFHGRNQATVAVPLKQKGWKWVGHPDGLICPDTRPLTTQGMPDEIKKAIREELDAGYMVLLEIKTMAPNSFGTFSLHGLSGDQFLSKYLYQIHGYFEGMTQSPNALAGLGLPPRKCLVVAMDVDSKRRAYELVNRDPEIITEALAWVNELAHNLAMGVMPEPDYSGADLACRFCSVTQHCPAAQMIRSQRQVSSAALDADTDRLNELAALYTDYGIQIDAMESARKGVKEEIEETLGGIPRVETDEWVVRRSEVAGRASLNRKAVEIRYKDLGEELPMTYGQPYSRLTVTQLGKEEERDEKTTS